MATDFSFEDLSLSPALCRGVLAYGYRRPSGVQRAVLRAVLRGEASDSNPNAKDASAAENDARGADCVAQAASGTGKSASVALAALALCEKRRGVDGTPLRTTQVLILSPTRELATQTTMLVRNLGQFTSVSAHACVGGRSLEEDVRQLEGGVAVVSGTPGRVLDMIRKRILRTPQIQLLALDEADEMLGKGFKGQIHDIYRYLPPVQVLLLSATMPGDVLRLTENFMVDPIKILLPRDEITVDTIRQYYVDVDKEEHKFDCLCELYGMLTIAHAVVFCNTRKKVEWLSRKMTAARFVTRSMHGDMTQAERDLIMASFRDGQARVLITTDVWSRGIDVEHVSLIVNYDLPTARELYVHRIGRTGRFGRTGVAISLLKHEELLLLKDIEQFYSITINELPEEMGNI